MIRRSGTTLVEVLVAIFVTALGLLGLLALFPLGAVNMAQAIKDSRCAQAAANAAALAEAMNIRNDPALVNPDVFIDPGLVDPQGNKILASADGPSYPVYVDPFGAASSLALPCTASGHVKGGGIPRRSVSFVAAPPHGSGKGFATAVERFTLLDDISFVKDGPSTGMSHLPGQQVQREGRYSWTYLLQRPRSSDPSVVNLTVVVYSGRGLQFNQGEIAYGPVAFDPTTNLVSVAWGPGQASSEKPAIRTGSWILDATMVKEVPPGSGRFQPDPHGFFYRVVNVTEKPNQLDLELQTNPRKGTINGTTPYGVLVVLDNVVEVFEKGPGWRR